MFNLFKKKKCKSGFHKVGKRCIKTELKRERDKKECKLDGKTFCKARDKPLRLTIARAGGKSQLADKIISKMKSHDVYNEPFLGGGAVFLKKPLAKKNIINDKDKDVITVFKAFKNKDGFQKCDMKGSKSKFDKIKNIKNKSACDVVYISKWSFGSNTNSKRYVLEGNQKKKIKQYGNRFKPKDKTFGIKYQKTHQEDYKEKLKNVTILNQDFEQVMKKADSKQTFHYLDPPYIGAEKVYKENDSVTPERVCSVAKKMKGKVLISYNENPRVRKACKGMKFSKVNTKYSLSRGDSGVRNNKHKELLITNY